MPLIFADYAAFYEQSDIPPERWEEHFEAFRAMMHLVFRASSSGKLSTASLAVSGPLDSDENPLAVEWMTSISEHFNQASGQDRRKEET